MKAEAKSSDSSRPYLTGLSHPSAPCLKGSVAPTPPGRSAAEQFVKQSRSRALARSPATEEKPHSNRGFSSHRRLELHGRRRTAHSLSSHCESVCECVHAPAERACVSRRVRPLLPPWVTTGSTHEFHSAARDLAPALLLGRQLFTQLFPGLPAGPPTAGLEI